MSHQVHTYTELKQKIHHDLRTQHPEWIQPNGRCPECDKHEARLMELIEALARTESNTEAGQPASVEEEQPEARHETS